MSRWRLFFQLPPHERWVLCYLTILLFCVELILHVSPFSVIMEKLRRRAAGFNRRIRNKVATADSTIRLARLVDIADRHGLFKPSCLRKAVLFAWLLGSRGVTSAVHIGVTKDAEALKAHAWLETTHPFALRFFEEAEFSDLIPAHFAAAHAL